MTANDSARLNPNSLLHGSGANRINSSKLKSTQSVPNLDQSTKTKSKAASSTNNNESIHCGSSSSSKKTKSSGYGKLCDKIKLFEPNLNNIHSLSLSSSKRSSSIPPQQRKKNNGRNASNYYYNLYHNHSVNRQQTDRENSTYKGNESNDGKLTTK